MTNQEAIRLIRNHPTMCEFPDAYGKPYYEAVDMAISALQAQDEKHSTQPEIVRCKDCIYAHSEVWLTGGGKSEGYAYGYCGKTNLKILPYDFCSRAERRTDEGD